MPKSGKDIKDKKEAARRKNQQYPKMEKVGYVSGPERKPTVAEVVTGYRFGVRLLQSKVLQIMPHKRSCLL